MEVGEGPNVGCSAKGKRKYLYLRPETFPGKDRLSLKAGSVSDAFIN
jgi:hypothetical protein